MPIDPKHPARVETTKAVLVALLTRALTQHDALALRDTDPAELRAHHAEVRASLLEWLRSVEQSPDETVTICFHPEPTFTPADYERLPQELRFFLT